MSKFYWALTIVFFVFVGFLFLLNQTRTLSTVHEKLLSVQKSDWTRGKEDSRVTLIEYIDFQCPACGAYYPLVKQIERKYSDRVRFVVRNFPLVQIHHNAMPAAMAAESAGKQGKFWEMHDILFENQKEWSNVNEPSGLFASYAEVAGVDHDKFFDDYASNFSLEKIKSDISSGLKSGVQGTPTFFLDGRKIQNPQSYEAFEALIEKALIKSDL